MVATGSKTKRREATASAAIDEIREGNQGMRSDLKAESPAQDRIPTAISAGSSSRAPSSVDVSMTSDADMAGLPAIAADVCSTGHERTMTLVESGCGENHSAIERILFAVMSSRIALPVAIFDRLTRWPDRYVGCPEEPREHHAC